MFTLAADWKSSEVSKADVETIRNPIALDIASAHLPVVAQVGEDSRSPLTGVNCGEVVDQMWSSDHDRFALEVHESNWYFQILVIRV